MNVFQWFQQLDYSKILEILLLTLASLFCIIFHECAHGMTALWLGDPTAKRMGRLTLNPLRHIDPMGLLLMIIAHIGWAKPVPVDMRNFKHPKWGMALTALAGPICNFLTAILFAVPMLVLYTCIDIDYNEVLFWIALFCEYVFMLSIGLGIFNLLPIPPLDGSKILFSVLPSRAYLKLMRYEKYGILFLFAIFVIIRFVPGLSSPLDTAIVHVSGWFEKLAVPAAKWILKLIYPDILFT